MLNRISARSTVIALVSLAILAATGCKGAVEDAKNVYNGKAGASTESATASRPRVNAVAQMGTSTIPEGWCTVKYEPGKGPKLVLPAVDVFNQGPTAVTGRPRWINMWATWCKPCIAELPHILKWTNARLGTGTDVSLELLSVDEDMVGFRAFLARHMELRQTKLFRMSTPSGLGTFAQSLGLGADTTVPIHIFTDRSDNIVCVRTGGIAESDVGVIRELLK